MARKRIEWVRREPDAHLLARVLQRVAKEEVIKAEKDYCLIDAARQTDHAVVSHDDNARRRYARVATQGVEELKRIAWISPTDADCLPWLRAGAKAEARFTLGAPFLDG